MKKKRIAALTAALWLLLTGMGSAEVTVERLEGVDYFPSEENWTYRFSYAYPFLTGDSYTELLINDTFQMALDEMEQLILPMFAADEGMCFSEHNEIVYDFQVVCNNDRFLSILQQKSMPQGTEKPLLTLEALVFDMTDTYAGETLTLRGLTQEGENLVGESSAQIGEAVMPLLRAEFLRLQEAGIVRADCTEEEFELACVPTRDYYADQENRVVFFFQPDLLTEPSFEVPTLVFSVSELAALLEGKE